MKIDAITDTYKLKNEDKYGMTKHAFWVMDGALSLNKNNYTDDGNDVFWMVNWWNSYLEKHLDNFDKSIVALLEEGVDRFNADFSIFVNINELSKLDVASSGIAIVRINGEIVETYVLGDVEIDLKKKDAGIDTLIDEKIETLDNQVMDMIFNNQNRENEVIFNGYTKGELKVLRCNRMKMNTKQGYYILEHDKEAIKYGIYKEYNKNEISSILIMSDGYSAIYNKYKEFSKEELFEVCINQGVKNVLDKIRTIEDDDLDMKKHKRLRLHDDATALFFRI